MEVQKQSRRSEVAGKVLPESTPPATMDMPMTAPVMEWVVDTGSSRKVARMSQMPVAIMAHSMPYLQKGVNGGQRQVQGPMRLCSGSVTAAGRHYLTAVARVLHRPGDSLTCRGRACQRSSRDRQFFLE